MQIARVIGRHERSVRQRIDRYPELSAFYTKRSADAIPLEPPTEADMLLRTSADLPNTVPSQTAGKMVLVTEALLGGGLAKLGVPQATIAKLRNLSDLRIDAGAMLAVSLQDTHQLYYLQLLALQARADEIKAKYLSEDAETTGENDGAPPALTAMERMFWQRTHTEIIEQLGKGYDRMLVGTQAMVAMMKGRDKGDAPVKADAGWEIQVPKSMSKNKPAKP